MGCEQDYDLVCFDQLPADVGLLLLVDVVGVAISRLISVQLFRAQPSINPKKYMHILGNDFKKN